MFFVGCGTQKQESQFITSIKNSLNTEVWKYHEGRNYYKLSKEDMLIKFSKYSCRLYTNAEMGFLSQKEVILTKEESHIIREICLKIRAKYHEDTKRKLFSPKKKKYKCRNSRNE